MKTDALDAATTEVAQAVKRIVREFDPEAEVILYGSRARGDAEPESDWDFAVITSYAMTSSEKRELYGAIYDYELNNNLIISPFVVPRSHWDSDLHRATFFHKNVDREGCRV